MRKPATGGQVSKLPPVPSPQAALKRSHPHRAAGIGDKAKGYVLRESIFAVQGPENITIVTDNGFIGGEPKGVVRPLGNTGNETLGRPGG